MKTKLQIVGLAILIALPMPAVAQGLFSSRPASGNTIIKPLPGKEALKSARGVTPQERIRNDQSAFSVRINVCLLDDQGKLIEDRPSRNFAQGECMGVKVVSERPGYLYLLYKQADGAEKCLFPNKFDQNNRIQAQEIITVPDPRYDFNLRITPPFGEETLIALVSQRPLSGEAFGQKSLTQNAVTDISLDTVIAKGVEAELRHKPDQWAEHSLTIQTYGKGRSTQTTTKKKKRIGLFVGISQYKDDRISDLHICHTDAQVMAEAMQKYSNLDAAGVLVDDQATRAAVEAAFKELIEVTLPGDDIFIFWSGHGATCADTGGEDNEADGLDEFLVTYDASPEDLENTVVMDDALGRWVQALDGRNITVILDACHSGGAATNKGLDGDDSGLKGGLFKENKKRNSGGQLGSIFNSPNSSSGDKTLNWCFKPAPMDLLDGELSRIKDIGQKDATMLASSASDEISAERRDQKLSVMTYFLVEQIVNADSLTLADAYRYIRVEVPKYMQEHFPGRTQTPVLVPEGAATRVRLK
jgi:uncharacterized protein DUF4384/caspase domain-containing protein